LCFSGALASLWFFELFSLPAGLLQYSKHWSFHGSIFDVAEIFMGSYARMFCLLGAGFVVLYAQLSKPLFEQKILWVCAAFVLFSPTVHPWYLLWVLPFSLICQQKVWLWLYTVYPIFYVALTSIDPTTGAWNPPLWPQLLTYIPFFACLVLQVPMQIVFPKGKIKAWWDIF